MHITGYFLQKETPVQSNSCTGIKPVLLHITGIGIILCIDSETFYEKVKKQKQNKSSLFSDLLVWEKKKIQDFINNILDVRL